MFRLVLVTMKLVVVILVLVAFVGNCQVKNESDVGFPEHERVDVDRTSTRIPLYIPGKCPENQLLYPGDKKNDWVCDCGPGFVYYPLSDGCFAVYRQGPCPKGQYLILPKGHFNPQCIENTCKEDGQVMYKNECYVLNKPGKPCKPIEEGGGIFGVNSTTLELECLIGTDRLSIFQFPNNCPLGSQRDRTNRCRPTY